MKFAATLIGIVCCLAAAAEAPASAIGWTIAKSRGFLQTADDTAPTAPLFYEVFARFSADNAGDFSAVSLSGPEGGPFALSNLPGGGQWRFSQQFFSEAALDAAFPSGGAYSIDAQTSLGVISEPVPLDIAFPEPLPRFTGPVFSALQGMNPTADFEFTWNALPFADEETQVLFTLLDAGTGDPVYAAQVTGATAEVVAGGTLEPGRAYFASIEFRRTRPSERTRLATGEETTSAGTVTAIEFRTAAVPEPFSLLALSVLAAGLAGWRRGRR